MTCHDIAEQSVVCLKDALGVIIAGALQQLSRTDEVGKEDGDNLGALRHGAKILHPATVSNASAGMTTTIGDRT